jgi:triphosphoribosyl-dephospho-CoA synthase
MTAASQKSQSQAALQAAVREACLAELQALKPGNVSAHPLAYNPAQATLTVRDFVLSAQAIAAPLTTPAQSSVGERVLAAITATRAVVATNTNLGIVLLAAPLLRAEQSRKASQSLHESLRVVLSQLTVADAELAYKAIRLAEAGGMGVSTEEDITQTPTVSLLEAMRMAAARDAVARAYGDNFSAVFEIGLPELQRVLHLLKDSLLGKAWATTIVFLRLLAQQPDSLIERKYGVAKAREVSDLAHAYWLRADAAVQRRDTFAASLLEVELAAWDKALKTDQVNPGTTADFTVATHLAFALQHQGAALQAEELFGDEAIEL